MRSALLAVIMTLPTILGLTEQEIEAAFASNDTELQQMIYRAATHPYYTFEPRPDDPENWDEQTGFINSDSAISFCIGGNGSGKTVAGAVKCARFVLEKQPPPREDTPFWIISETYDQVCGVCWFEKLREILPPEAVDYGRIHWYQEKRNWPFSVPLMPWPDRPGKNWVLEFKSYEQGRERMQARSIGGAWFSEQFPWEIFEEVIRGCRDYMFPGGVWAEFTPIDPDKSEEIEIRYDNPPRNYAFYRLNTDRNTAVSEDWKEAFFDTVSEEMQATRKIGAFASYEGAIYQSFNPRIHLVEDIEVPRGVWHRRSIDWGASAEHPFVNLWGFKNSLGQWFIYDEYWNNSQSATALDHIEEIKDRYIWPNSPYYGSTYADPSRPDLINLFSAHGIPINAAANAVNEGIECVRRHLKVLEGLGEPMLFIDKNSCPKLASQMRTYRWMRGNKSGLNPRAGQPKPLKRDDDAVDALRYLIYSDYSHKGEGLKSDRIMPDASKHGILLRRKR